jgi:hypothetical protein
MPLTLKDNSTTIELVSFKNFASLTTYLFSVLWRWRHDNQHNNTHQNTQHNDAYHSSIHYNGIQHNNTQHYDMYIAVCNTIFTLKNDREKFC